MSELQSQVPSFRGWRAEVGMLSPAAGMYREYEIVAPEGVKFSRVVLPAPAQVVPEEFKKMGEAVEAEAKKFISVVKPDLICLGCTSASFVGGPGYDQQLIKRIEEASGSPATTTATCMVEVFKDMGIKKIALVGPYVKELFDIEVEFLKAHDIETLCVKYLGIAETSAYYDYYMDPYRVYHLAKEGNKAAPDADCVFVSCMWSTILGVVDALEKEIGKPVISSCSASLYGILKKLGIPDPVYHYGEALTRPRL